MHKKITIASIITMSLLISTPQVFALKLEVSENGTIYSYEDDILGDNSKNQINNKKRTLIRTIKPGNTSIHVETNDNLLRVDLKNKYTSSNNKKEKFEKIESSKVSRLEMEMPTKRINTKQKITKKADAKKDLSKKEKYLEKLRVERKERTQEKIRLKNEQKENGKQKIKLESRGISAMLVNAEFNYDPKTGSITLTTPSGNEHELNHLPDQAIKKMIEKFDDIPQASEIQIETTDDGMVSYKALGKKQKKLLGLVSRDINTEITLNDQTGDINETILPAKTALGRLLDKLSF